MIDGKIRDLIRLREDLKARSAVERGRSIAGSTWRVLRLDRVNHDAGRQQKLTLEHLARGEP
jgi:hypothetical protein